MVIQQVISSSDKTIKIWDVANAKLKFTFDWSNGGHTTDTEVLSLTSLKSVYLASGSLDKTVKIWDISNGKFKNTFDQSNGGHIMDVLSLIYTN